MTEVLVTGLDDFRGAVRGRRDRPRRSLLRRGADALQRDDRQEAGADRALPDVADVIGAVNFAREGGMEVAIRGGGHNGGGLGSVDDGLVIDLSPMNDVRVDPDARTVTAGGGALLGDVDHATHAFGLALPAGSSRPRASAGSPSAAGRRASHARPRPDYRQPARGGRRAGRRQLRQGERGRERRPVLGDPRRRRQLRRRDVAHASGSRPVGNVVGGPMWWPIERTEEILRWYREFIRRAAGISRGLLRLPQRSARSAVPGGAPPARRSAASRGAAAASTRPTSCSRPARALEPGARRCRRRCRCRR